MSFDRRVRESLLRAADVEGDPDVERSLHRVLTRRRRRVRTRRAALALATAGVAAAVAVGLPAVLDELRAQRDTTGVTPADAPRLPGTYIVDVGDSELAEQHGMSGRWVIELRADGSVHMAPPSTFDGPTSGFSYRAEGNEVRVDAFISDPLCTTVQAVDPVGIYGWTRTVATLELTAVSETCEPRRLLFAGQAWEVLR